jgi:nicotinate phosphoribosyltransferase
MAAPAPFPHGAFRSGPLLIDDAALWTDLYEITMAAVYHHHRMQGLATFSLFVRRLPKSRGYLIAAGLEDVLDFLESFRFSRRAVDYLRSQGGYAPDFLGHLQSLRFTGEVRAIREGTVVFPDEPLLEITAPIMEAQLIETAVLNFCHYQTLACTKAARVVDAAQGRGVVEFGLRRTHGIDAGMKAARAAYLAGAASTSNVLAGLTWGIPTTGTMAHSFVSAFREEGDAFRAFGEVFPGRTTLLLDTYDTVAAARKAVVVAQEMAAAGGRLTAVRLDSGDLLALSRAVRRILDEAGLTEVRIFASGNLDEYEIATLLAAGAPIDAFGVGTRMTVSADAPYLDMAYKLVRYDGRDVLKVSPGKETWTGEKQVYRFQDPSGQFIGDLLARRDEPEPAGGRALLEVVMQEGTPIAPDPSLDSIRDHCARQRAALPEEVRRIADPASYPVMRSHRLLAAQAERKAKLQPSMELIR